MPMTPMPPILREKYPNLERFWPFLQTLREESPRGTVLISCGFVEQQLKEILLAFMLDDADVEQFVEGRKRYSGNFHQNRPDLAQVERVGASQ